MSSPRDEATIAATAGVVSDEFYRSIAPPLWSSDTFEWDSPEDKPDFDYSRTVNPNRALLGRALAELEGAAGCAITSSGQSACMLALLLLPQGARVVAPHDCYGGTFRLLQGLADNGTLKVRFVDQRDDGAFANAIGGGAEMVWLETPSNPLMRVVDIERRALEAKSAGALVVADNTLPTPCRQNPIALGCDLVMHSTTKAINGHHDLFGGALAAADAEVAEKMDWWANAAGLSGSAFDSWQILRGLRTMPLRVDQQERSALAIARWLETHDQVAEVFYPGLESHPDHVLSARQTRGPGFLLSFRIKGDLAKAQGFVKALKLITLASSLGGFSSLICTPATMTHRGMPPEAQLEAGITTDLLRLSVGLEGAEALIADLAGGFDAIA